MSNGTPPIIPDPTPPAPGIPQPVFASGDADTPAVPQDITGSPIIPPPIIGDPVGVPTFPPGTDDTAPVAVPVGPQVGPAISPAPVPPSIPGVPQPQFGSGGVTTPETLFPGLFTTDPPSPPIVFANIAMIGDGNPPPSTPGIAPVVQSDAWAGPPSPDPPPVPFPNPPLEPEAPINLDPPAISGTLAVGEVLTATTGDWTDSPTAYAYQWLNNGSPIAGAVASTYTLETTDEGAMIAVEVTATNAAGSTAQESEEVGPIAAASASEPLTLAAAAPAPKARPKPRSRKKR